MSFETRAYAKINLWLDITGRRADGYHLLNTVMRRVDLYDTVTLEPDGSGVVIIECDAAGVPSDETNIAYKAAVLFRGLIGRSFGVRIEIKKRIPTEAGLGGSSADGAAVLTGLNKLFGEPFSSARLSSEGAKLGADVPFCITGGTAVCKGIGELITPVSCADMYAVIIKPEFSCSTSDAYKRYDERPMPEKNGFEGFVASLDGDASKTASCLYNVFESLYCDRRIENVKNRLISAGAMGACLSGSGSAVFGLFGTMESALEACESLEYREKYAVRCL